MGGSGIDGMENGNEASKKDEMQTSNRIKETNDPNYIYQKEGIQVSFKHTILRIYP